ncbi:acetoacetate decarboxylase family protein [Spectribacter hydrogenooxidans]|uniref:Acetoacetate decarboxylase family protein n=1 Tax=Spectribacter hydrogenoxidans TaxID=3075608 RepID=A0ABU3BZG8_9GAMM|nr:acetoacetate decarboxylase family protein [Salinisphaera sp. W335]MDT0634711.1 acetoacetate decarboxylase family protein [Salinisphaera sp. W335]
MTESQPIHAPPPWQLRGQGYIILIRCSRDFGEHCAADVPGLAGRALGGIGTVMVVDYSESAVGPYRELLLVPGRFEVEGRKRFAVTDILVSSQPSVDNGRRNWGLPKALASFQHHTVESGNEHVRVSRDDRPFAELRFARRSLSWPVTTALAPGGWHTLVQPWEGRRYTTRISARGRVRPARLTKCRIDDAVFPDFSSQRVLSCLQVTSFSMVFPPAIVEDAA